MLSALQTRALIGYMANAPVVTSAQMWMNQAASQPAAATSVPHLMANADLNSAFINVNLRGNVTGRGNDRGLAIAVTNTTLPLSTSTAANANAGVGGMIGLFVNMAAVRFDRINVGTIGTDGTRIARNTIHTLSYITAGTNIGGSGDHTGGLIGFSNSTIATLEPVFNFSNINTYTNINTAGRFNGGIIGRYRATRTAANIDNGVINVTNSNLNANFTMRVRPVNASNVPVNAELNRYTGGFLGGVGETLITSNFANDAPVNVIRSFNMTNVNIGGLIHGQMMVGGVAGHFSIFETANFNDVTVNAEVHATDTYAGGFFGWARRSHSAAPLQTLTPQSHPTGIVNSQFVPTNRIINFVRPVVRGSVAAASHNAGGLIGFNVGHTLNIHGAHIDAVVRSSVQAGGLLGSTTMDGAFVQGGVNVFNQYNHKWVVIEGATGDHTPRIGEIESNDPAVTGGAAGVWHRYVVNPFIPAPGQPAATETGGRPTAITGTVSALGGANSGGLVGRAGGHVTTLGAPANPHAELGSTTANMANRSINLSGDIRIQTMPQGIASSTGRLVGFTSAASWINIHFTFSSLMGLHYEDPNYTDPQQALARDPFRDIQTFFYNNNQIVRQGRTPLTTSLLQPTARASTPIETGSLVNANSQRVGFSYSLIERFEDVSGGVGGPQYVERFYRNWQMTLRHDGTHDLNLFNIDTLAIEFIVVGAPAIRLPVRTGSSFNFDIGLVWFDTEAEQDLGRFMLIEGVGTRAEPFVISHPLHFIAMQQIFNNDNSSNAIHHQDFYLAMFAGMPTDRVPPFATAAIRNNARGWVMASNNWWYIDRSNVPFQMVNGQAERVIDMNAFAQDSANISYPRFTSIGVHTATAATAAGNETASPAFARPAQGAAAAFGGNIVGNGVIVRHTYNVNLHSMGLFPNYNNSGGEGLIQDFGLIYNSNNNQHLIGGLIGVLRSNLHIRGGLYNVTLNNGAHSVGGLVGHIPANINLHINRPANAAAQTQDPATFAVRENIFRGGLGTNEEIPYSEDLIDLPAIERKLFLFPFMANINIATSVTGHLAGGLVGDLYGGLNANNIGSVAADGTITKGITVNIRGRDLLGGLVGHGRINSVFVANGVHIDGIVSSGDNTDRTHGTGGFIGDAHWLDVTNSSFTGSIAGITYLGGVTGRIRHSTTMPHTIAAFNWYANIVNARPVGTYPRRLSLTSVDAGLDGQAHPTSFVFDVIIRANITANAFVAGQRIGGVTGDLVTSLTVDNFTLTGMVLGQPAAIRTTVGNTGQWVGGVVGVAHSRNLHTLAIGRNSHATETVNPIPAIGDQLNPNHHTLHRIEAGQGTQVDNSTTNPSTNHASPGIFININMMVGQNSAGVIGEIYSGRYLIHNATVSGQISANSQNIAQSGVAGAIGRIANASGSGITHVCAIDGDINDIAGGLGQAAVKNFTLNAIINAGGVINVGGVIGHFRVSDMGARRHRVEDITINNTIAGGNNTGGVIGFIESSGNARNALYSGHNTVNNVIHGGITINNFNSSHRVSGGANTGGLVGHQTWWTGNWPAHTVVRGNVSIGAVTGQAIASTSRIVGHISAGVFEFRVNYQAANSDHEHRANESVFAELFNGSVQHTLGFDNERPLQGAAHVTNAGVGSSQNQNQLSFRLTSGAGGFIFNNFVFNFERIGFNRISNIPFMTTSGTTTTFATTISLLWSPLAGMQDAQILGAWLIHGYGRGWTLAHLITLVI
jgi:hypothetical protein